MKKYDPNCSYLLSKNLNSVLHDYPIQILSADQSNILI